MRIRKPKVNFHVSVATRVAWGRVLAEARFMRCCSSSAAIVSLINALSRIYEYGPSPGKRRVTAPVQIATRLSFASHLRYLRSLTRKQMNHA